MKKEIECTTLSFYCVSNAKICIGKEMGRDLYQTVTRIGTTVWLHQCTTKTLQKSLGKARWELHVHTTSWFEQILESTP